MLNMCSAADPMEADPLGDPMEDARARLVAAAVELIGRDGVRATTVRRVAEAVGVSAPLVAHHFGSKAGLVEACDRAVLTVLDEVMATIAEQGADEGALQLLLRMDEAVSALAYIGRSLQDGGDAGRFWFDQMLRITQEAVGDLEAAGAVHRSDDPVMRAVLLLAMDLGAVLLRSHVERVLGSPITDPAIADRWIRAEFDLLANGLFIDSTAEVREKDAEEDA
jgi:TetR/AcrR family transcriptional regulator, regulator of cefoperazone and chloramphenicol sensitivity